MKHRPLALLAATLLSSGLVACSSPGEQDAGGPTVLDVWLMRDSVSDAFQKEFEAGFEKAHPEIDLKIQIQEWEGIGEKVTAALASNDAPDVIEVGNTQVAQYAQSGGLTDFTGKVDDLDGDFWLEGLAEPGAWEGRQYGSRTTPPTGSSSTAPTSSSRPASTPRRSRHVTSGSPPPRS